MQRKPTRQSRGPNAAEKLFMAYTKESDCIVCQVSGPSIVDHVVGATFKHNKVLIGHWFLLPLCVQCDEVKTLGSLKRFREKFGALSQFWSMHMVNSGMEPPTEVVESIVDWGK